MVLIVSVTESNIYSQTKSSNNQTFSYKKPEDKIIWYMKTADSLIDVRKQEQGEVLYELAYTMIKKVKNDSLFVVVGNKYSDALYNLTKMSRATELNQMIIDFCKNKKNRLGLINAYLIKGRIVAYHHGEKYEALQLFSKAIDLLDTTAPNSLIVDCFYERGYLFLDMAQNEVARKDFHCAVANVKDKDGHQITYLYSGIADTFSKKELDSMAHYQNLVIDQCKKKDFIGDFCLEAYNKLAYTLILKNEPKKAKAMLEEHIDEDEISERLNDGIYYQFMRTKGSIHLMSGEYKPAIEKLTIAKNYALQRRDLNNSLLILEDLSKAYEKDGDFISSLKTTRMIKPLMDTLDVQKIQKEVAKLETQRKLKEKEKQINALLEEKQTITLKMSTAQLTSYILGALLLIGMFIFFNRMWANKVKFHKLNEKVNHNRLLSLQSAMNPHFLFNTFGTLQHFILKKQVEKANSYMTTLSDLIRNVFASSNSIYIHFTKEITILKSYIDLELGRFDHNFEVAFEIPKALSNNDPLIPAMILQPYIENAIIHGFSEKKGDKKLTITFTMTTINTIQCDITDNGVGREKVGEIQGKSTVKKNLSVATRNTQERLRIINKKDEQKGNIVIQDLYDTDGNAKGTKVIISLPIIKSKKH